MLNMLNACIPYIEFRLLFKMNMIQFVSGGLNLIFESFVFY